MKFDEKIQIILIGDCGVGKTSLGYQFSQKSFSNQHISTIGVEFFIKEELINDKIIRIKIWDTAGQEKYLSLTKAFYKNCNGVIVVYDVTEKSSFDNIQFWLKNIKENADSGVKMMLVGNKIDLENRKINSIQGRKLAQDLNILFSETSAKDNKGVSEAFEKFLYELVGESIKNNVKDNNSNSRESIKISKEKICKDHDKEYCKC